MKSMMISVLFFTCLFDCILIAQSVQKHPKVAELERFVSKEAFDYVKGRFPGEPVLVEVSIDPLRRNTQPSRSTGDGDFLPFNTSVLPTEVDEWDDPSLTIQDLIPRIRSASVKVILPSKISDAEVLELRDSLFSNLKLIFGRDKIEFERRLWKSERSIQWIDLAIIAAILSLFLPVLYWSIRSAASKLSQGISEISSGMTNLSGGTPAPVAPVQNSKSTDTSDRSKDFRFNDPIKIAEKIKPVIDLLEADPSFPDLEDMILFDEGISKKPEQVGALIRTMPRHMQERLFMLSYKPVWLEAFIDIGELSTETYEFANRLSIKDRKKENKEWEELLILVWRLEDSLTTLMQKINQDEALAILAAMPSRISIPAGKRALPGSWASLLDPEFKMPILNASRISELQKIALEMRPYSDISMLQRYRHEKGLVEYLHTASVRDEREVYEAARLNSNIRTLRPPFFPILNIEPEEFKKIIPSFAIETWALALYNVNRDERMNFEKALSEKQRYFFIESLKMLNLQNLKDEQIGNARLDIAKFFSAQDLKNRIEKVETTPAVKEEEKSENHQAA